MTLPALTSTYVLIASCCSSISLLLAIKHREIIKTKIRIILYIADPLNYYYIRLPNIGQADNLIYLYFIIKDHYRFT